MPFLTAAELHALKPLGATVRFTDGTPKPPARFNKKLAEWERSNGLGVYVEQQDAQRSVRAHFAIETIRMNHFRSRSIRDVDSVLRYEIVRLPAPFVIVEDASTIAPGWLRVKDGAADTLAEAEDLKARHEAASSVYPLTIYGVTEAIRAALTEAVPA